MKQFVSHTTIAVLGASGATGRQVVARALAGGHDVVALVRRPGLLEPMPGLTETIWEDVAAVDELATALRGVDVVVSALGGAGRGATTICADAAASTVSAMGAAGVGRLIAVSAHGVLETHDRSLYSRAVWSSVAERMRDKEAMESVISSSGLAWTIIRPPMLKDGPATGGYRAGDTLPIRLWHSIGRADLADFIVREADDALFVHRYPRIHR